MKIISFLSFLKRNAVCIITCLMISVNAFSQSKPLTIDITQGKNEIGQILLSEVADSVEYIQLSAPVPLSYYAIGKISISSNHIATIDIENHRVLLFDRKGTFLRYIGETGDTTGSYLYPMDVIIDEPGNNIFILENQRRKLLQFDLDGKFRKESALLGFPQYFFKLGNTFMFITPSAGTNNNNLYPNIYQSDPDGSVLNSIKLPEKHEQSSYSISYTYEYQNRLVFWQTNSDTVCNISGQSALTPRIILKDDNQMPKEALFHDKDFMKAVTTQLAFDRVMESKHYYFIDALYQRRRKFIVHKKGQDSNFNLIYHLPVMDHGFINDLDGGPAFLPENQINELLFYQVMNSKKFLAVCNHPYTKAFKAKYSDRQERLNDFVSKLDATQGIVLLIAKFKE